MFLVFFPIFFYSFARGRGIPEFPKMAFHMVYVILRRPFEVGLYFLIATFFPPNLMSYLLVLIQQLWDYCTKCLQSI